MIINSLNDKLQVKNALRDDNNSIDLLDKEYLANNQYGLPKDSSSSILCKIFEDGKTIMDFSVSDSEFSDNSYYSYNDNGDSLYYSDSRAVIKNSKDGYSFSVDFGKDTVTENDLEQYSLDELRKMGKIDKIYITENADEGKQNYTYCFNSNGEAVNTYKVLQQQGEEDKTLYSREYNQNGILESKIVDIEGDGNLEYQYTPEEEYISLDIDCRDYIISDYSKNIASILEDANEEVKIEESIGEQDGIISDMRQRGIGDCWLIASLKSLSMSEGGSKVINNAIKKNEDGSYTVTMSGINSQYTITMDEIIERTQSDTCTIGDIDATIIELAFEKARADKEPILNTIRNFSYDISKFFKKGGGNKTPLTFGNLADVIKFLTGDKVSYVVNTPFTKSSIDDFYEKFQNNPSNTIAVAHFLNLNLFEDNLDGEIYGGGNIELTDFGMHVFSIKSINDDTIKIIDPSNTKFSYEMSKEEFKDKIAYIEYYQFE